MATDEQPTPIVRHDADEGRWEVVVDGQVVAFTEHRPSGPGVELFPHTLTDPDHRGHGYAAMAVAAAMADATDRGVKVIPACWFVARWIEDHPEYAEIRA